MEAPGDFAHCGPAFKSTIFGYSVEFREEVALILMSYRLEGWRGLENAREFAHGLENGGP